MSKKTSRRKLLTGLSAGATAALAGCSSIFGSGNGGGNGNSGSQTPSPSNFKYPEGFSKKGIEDFATALGKKSAHYKSDSFRFDSEYQFERPDGSTQKLTARSQVSGANEKQYYYSENKSSIQEQYHNGSTVYLRLYSKKQKQAQYQVQEAQFNKEGAYLLTLFQNQLKDVDFSVDKVLSQSRVRYKATLDGLPDDHFMFKQYNNLVEFETLLTIDTDGYVRRVEVNLSREVQTKSSGGQQSGDSSSDSESSTTVIDESYWFEFKKHGEVTVQEPDWLSEAKKAAQQQSDGSSSDGSSSDGSTSDGSTSDGSTDSTSSIKPVGF